MKELRYQRMASEGELLLASVDRVIAVETKCKQAAQKSCTAFGPNASGPSATWPILLVPLPPSFDEQLARLCILGELIFEEYRGFQAILTGHEVVI